MGRNQLHFLECRLTSSVKNSAKLVLRRDVVELDSRTHAVGFTLYRVHSADLSTVYIISQKFKKKYNAVRRGKASFLLFECAQPLVEDNLLVLATRMGSV